MGQFAVTETDRLRIADQCLDLQGRIKAGVIDPAVISLGLQALLTGTSKEALKHAHGKRDQPKKTDLAEERRVTIEANLRKHGHVVSVPKPIASNRNFAEWKKAGMGLFYHAPDAEVSYAAWMSSHGQSKHWTVADENERKKIVWEPCVIGYWFLAEITPACPRLKTSWNDLTAMPSFKLLSLEEYTIVYWTHRDLTGLRIDVSTWCWLRTRCGLSALFACDDGGEMSVVRRDASYLSAPYDDGGGRAVEVV